MNIVDCYAAILRMWKPGDRVFLFGFIERPPFAELTRWMKAIQSRPAFAVATGAKPSALNAA